MSSFDIFFTDYDYNKSKQWLINHESVLLKSIVVYIVTVLTIKYLQRNRKPFDLERPLIAWNAILAMFSLLGFLYIVPSLFKVIRDHGLLCTYHIVWV